MLYRDRRFIHVIVIASLALPAAGLFGMASPKKAGPRPNILYIMTDQQPVSCVAAYGNKIIKTPNLDSLARSGCTFHSAYIAAFPCSPSRACQLSGRYAHNHGVVTNDVLFDEKVPTLGNICRAAGYDTAHFGKWHLGGHIYRDPKEKDPLARYGGKWHYQRVPNNKDFQFEKVVGGFGEDKPQHGFDTWVGGWVHYRNYLRQVGLDNLLKGRWRIGGHNNYPSGSEGTHIYSMIPEEHNMAPFLSGHAEKYIRDRAKTEKPWCVVLSYYGPHLPVSPPKPWDTMYSLDQVTLPANHNDKLEGKPKSQQQGERTYKLGTWNKNQYKDYVRRYWGYCSFIDQQIGKVFDALRETGQWDNTIVLFTADHGDMVAAHGMIFKLGHCGYEELFRVPTMIYIPSVTKPGSQTKALVSNIDFLPTLLEAINIPAPGGVEGKSLLPLIKGKTKKHRDMIFSVDANRSLICRDKRYKFVLNWNKRDLDELYDLLADPGELNNLAYKSEYASIKSRMLELILDWLRETKYPYVQTVEEAAARQPAAIGGKKGNQARG